MNLSKETMDKIERVANFNEMYDLNFIPIKLIEEMAELTQLLSKYIIDSYNLTVEECENFYEEYADVMLMLMQMYVEDEYVRESLEDNINKKLDRTIERYKIK